MVILMVLLTMLRDTEEKLKNEDTLLTQILMVLIILLFLFMCHTLMYVIFISTLNFFGVKYEKRSETLFFPENTFQKILPNIYVIANLDKITNWKIV